MQRIFIFIAFSFLLVSTSLAQNNTFPASGYVGIGTTSPLTPIHIIGGPTMTAGWNKTSTLQATYPVQLYNSNNTKWAGVGYDFSTAMRFWVNSPNEDLPGYGTLGMTILNNGNIGIGSSNPESKLMVAGNIKTTNGGATWDNLNIWSDGFSSFIQSNGDENGLKIKSNTANKIILESNVWIGTDNPQTYLHAKGQFTPGYMQLAIQSSGTDDRSGVSFWNNNGERTGVFYVGEGGMIIGNGVQNSLLRIFNGSNEVITANSSNVGIGTMNHSEKLTVNGNIRAKKLIISQTSWSDYVFAKNYKLRSLLEVENYIKVNQHLPEMPSAKDVASNGISVGDTQALLLKKIEELTLYVIELKKENSIIKSEFEIIKKSLNTKQ